MKVERRGRRFNLNLDLIELLTLYALIGEEKISVNLEMFAFADPQKVKKVLEDFHDKVQELVIERTPEELPVRFFRP